MEQAALRAPRPRGRQVRVRASGPGQTLCRARSTRDKDGLDPGRGATPITRPRPIFMGSGAAQRHDDSLTTHQVHVLARLPRPRQVDQGNHIVQFPPDTRHSFVNHLKDRGLGRKPASRANATPPDTLGPPGTECRVVSDDHPTPPDRRNIIERLTGYRLRCFWCRVSGGLSEWVSEPFEPHLPPSSPPRRPGRRQRRRGRPSRTPTTPPVALWGDRRSSMTTGANANRVRREIAVARAEAGDATGAVAAVSAAARTTGRPRPSPRSPLSRRVSTTSPGLSIQRVRSVTLPGRRGVHRDRHDPGRAGDADRCRPGCPGSRLPPPGPSPSSASPTGSPRGRLGTATRSRDANTHAQRAGGGRGPSGTRSGRPRPAGRAPARGRPASGTARSAGPLDLVAGDHVVEPLRTP